MYVYSSIICIFMCKCFRVKISHSCNCLSIMFRMCAAYVCMCVSLICESKLREYALHQRERESAKSFAE